VAKYGYRNVPNYPEIKLKKKPPVVEEETAAKLKGKPLMTKEDIDAALLAEIESKAKIEERVRLSALDAMNPSKENPNPILTAIINKAKEDGKQPKDIALECYEAAQKQLKSSSTINALARDANTANSVVAGDAPIPKIFTPLSPQEQAQKRFSASLAQAVKAQAPANWRGNGSEK
jgi:hypothetical protein